MPREETMKIDLLITRHVGQLFEREFLGKVRFDEMLHLLDGNRLMIDTLRRCARFLSVEDSLAAGCK